MRRSLCIEALASATCCKLLYQLVVTTEDFLLQILHIATLSPTSSICFLCSLQQDSIGKTTLRQAASLRLLAGRQHHIAAAWRHGVTTDEILHLTQLISTIKE